MECNEFREQISAGTDFNNELIEHKNNCKNCQEWLKKELATAPNGLSKEDWKKAVENCFSSNIEEKEEINKKNNNQELNNNKMEENKSFMDYYFSGLKYGIVFGLAIVVGFSIIQKENELKDIKKNEEKSSIASSTSKIASESINQNLNASDSSLSINSTTLK